MATLSISNFDGIIPRTGRATLLPSNAQEARNVKLYSGEIRPWKRSTKDYVCQQEGVKTIARLEGPSGEDDWAEWTCDVDIAYSPQADLDEHRIFYSEDGVCKKTNWTMAHDGDTGPYPRKWLYMGVPRPSEAPVYEVVRASDTSADNTEERAYVYTFISTFGTVQEESAPSDAVVITCSIAGGTINFKDFPEAPTDHYNITALRIYRAVAGSEDVVYMLVDQLNYKNGKVVTTGTTLNSVKFVNGMYPDTRTTAQLGLTLESMYYQEPPDNLRGLVNMPNGMVAGFVGNQVWFCEPYLPHAWPSTYMLTVDSLIVGLGVYGNTLVVCTERQPYTMNGTHPSAITQEKLPMLQPCVNKKSIAYDQYGVIYASANGLVVIAGGQMDVFTRPLVDRDTWSDYNPVAMVGSMYNNLYMCGWSVGDEKGTIVFARSDTPAMVELDFDPICWFVERVTGDLYGLSHADNTIYKLDSSDVNKMTYEWKSKLFLFPRSLSFSCAKVEADYDNAQQVGEFNAQRQEIIDSNALQIEKYAGQCYQGCLNDSMVNVYTVDGGVLEDVPEYADLRFVQVTFYADGEAVYTKQVQTSTAFRLPRVNAYQWEVRFTGSLPLIAFQMATSMSELVQQ
jgi:hypothetical protein